MHERTMFKSLICSPTTFLLRKSSGMLDRSVLLMSRKLYGLPVNLKYSSCWLLVLRGMNSPDKPAALESAHSMRSSRSGANRRSSSNPFFRSGRDVETAFSSVRRIVHGLASAAIKARRERTAPAAVYLITCSRELWKSRANLIRFTRYAATEPAARNINVKNVNPALNSVPILDDNWV